MLNNRMRNMICIKCSWNLNNKKKLEKTYSIFVSFWSAPNPESPFKKQNMDFKGVIIQKFKFCQFCRSTLNQNWNFGLSNFVNTYVQTFSENSKNPN